MFTKHTQPQNTYFLDSLWYFCHSANIHAPTLQYPLSHWCWVWPCDLLWPMGFCQCDVSRSLNHACVIGFGSWAPACMRRTCLGGLCPIGFGHRTDNRWSRPRMATQPYPVYRNQNTVSPGIYHWVLGQLVTQHSSHNSWLIHHPTEILFWELHFETLQTGMKKTFLGGNILRRF